MNRPIRELDYDAPFVLRITGETGSRFDLRVDGRLPVDWAVRLTSSLSELHVDIRAGEARRHPEGEWDVVLHCHGYRSAPDASALRSALTSVQTVRAARFPALTRFELSPPGALGPARLRIVASDEVGFFGNLLRSLAMHGIFARSFEIATSDGVVDDVLSLSSLGMTGLSPGARASLVRELARACAAVS